MVFKILLFSNEGRVELIPNAMSSRHNSIAGFWFFGKFLVKYEINFFTRGNFIEGYIANTSIDVVATNFSYQLNSPLLSFACGYLTMCEYSIISCVFGVGNGFL